MERSLEDSIKNKTYIDNLRSAAKYSKEVIDLVEADIEYGLTMEQTNQDKDRAAENHHNC